MFAVDFAVCKGRQEIFLCVTCARAENIVLALNRADQSGAYMRIFLVCREYSSGGMYVHFLDELVEWRPVGSGPVSELRFWSFYEDHSR